MNIDTITKNINKLTNKEKVAFIQTLLGISVTLSDFLIQFQKNCHIHLPADLHYAILLSFANLETLNQDETTPEIKDLSLDIDSHEDKLISILKLLNRIYKDKINE